MVPIVFTNTIHRLCEEYINNQNLVDLILASKESIYQHSLLVEKEIYQRLEGCSDRSPLYIDNGSSDRYSHKHFNIISNVQYISDRSSHRDLEEPDSPQPHLPGNKTMNFLSNYPRNRENFPRIDGSHFG